MPELSGSPVPESGWHFPPQRSGIPQWKDQTIPEMQAFENSLCRRTFFHFPSETFVLNEGGLDFWIWETRRFTIYAVGKPSRSRGKPNVAEIQTHGTRMIPNEAVLFLKLRRLAGVVKWLLPAFFSNVVFAAGWHLIKILHGKRAVNLWVFFYFLHFPYCGATCGFLMLSIVILGIRGIPLGCGEQMGLISGSILKTVLSCPWIYVPLSNTKGGEPTAHYLNPTRCWLPISERWGATPDRLGRAVPEADYRSPHGS